MRSFLAVCLAIAVLGVAACHQSQIEVCLGRLAGSLDDPLPGARVRPTAEMLARTRESALQRRAESPDEVIRRATLPGRPKYTSGPSIEDVARAFGQPTSEAVETP